MLSAEAELLVRDNLQWAHGIASRLYVSRQWRRTGLELEDVQQAAAMGLMEAASRYVPSKSSFHTFAYRRVVGATLDMIRAYSHAPRRLVESWKQALHDDADKSSRHRPQMPRFFSFHARDWGGVDATGDRDLSRDNSPLEPVCYDPDHDPERIDPELLRTLQPRERAMIRLRFEECLDMHVIGDRLGVSESRVSQALKGAIQQLRCDLLDKTGQARRGEPMQRSAI